MIVQFLKKENINEEVLDKPAIEVIDDDVFSLIKYPPEYLNVEPVAGKLNAIDNNVYLKRLLKRISFYCKEVFDVVDIDCCPFVKYVVYKSPSHISTFKYEIYDMQLLISLANFSDYYPHVNFGHSDWESLSPGISFTRESSQIYLKITKDKAILDLTNHEADLKAAYDETDPRTRKECLGKCIRDSFDQMLLREFDFEQIYDKVKVRIDSFFESTARNKLLEK